MEIYNIAFYVIVFIIGTLFGSFYTLAIHRIPKRQDIVHTHSYCPNCNHKLGLLDLFPIFSYIFLRGKCRYCKTKIRPRYLILECLSGLLFVLITILLGVNIYNIDALKGIELGFMALFITFIILMGGIDKENIKIDKYVSIYGIIISLAYIVYLYVIDASSIYRYGIYLLLFIIILILDTITLKRQAKSRYINGILLSIITIAIFTGEYIAINTIILVLIAVAIYMLIKKIIAKKKRNRQIDKEFKNKVPMGFYLTVSNIINLIVTLGYINYIK